MRTRLTSAAAVAMIGIVGLGGTTARGDFLIQQGFAVGPNGASGSPSYPAWQLNAIQGISNGFTDVGDFATDPTAFHPVTSVDVRDIIPTDDFNSWRGIADPTGAFANELGNLLYSPVHIIGQGTRFSLSQVVFTGVSSDLPTDPAGSLLGNVTDLSNFTYSPGRVGVVHNADGTTKLITSGSPDQLVDELIYRGVGSYHQLLTVSGSGKTGQQVLDEEAALFASHLPLTFTATYAIYKDSTSRDPGSLLFSHSATLNIVPEPTGLFLLSVGGLTAVCVAWRNRRHPIA